MEDIKRYIKMGFGIWFEDNEKIILGRVLYEDSSGLEDWEEVTIYKDDGLVIHKYGTNRSVPGWSLNEDTGDWEKVY